jgi:hypothetical protein
MNVCGWNNFLINFEDTTMVNIDASLLNVLKNILKCLFYFFNEPSDIVYIK